MRTVTDDDIGLKVLYESPHDRSNADAVPLVEYVSDTLVVDSLALMLIVLL